MQMRVGDKKVFPMGWSVTVEPDPYGRLEYCAIAVRWDKSDDDLPEILYQFTVGLVPSAKHTQAYWRRLCREYEAITGLETRERIDAHLQQVLMAQRQAERARLRRARAREAAQRGRRAEAEARRAEYRLAIEEGDQGRAEWILKHARYKYFWQRFWDAYPARKRKS